MEALHKSFDGKPYQTLGLDIWDGSKPEAGNFILQYQITFPLLLNASEVETPYNCDTEYFFVVDGDGVIVYRAEKSFEPDSITKAVNEAIARLPISIENGKTSRIPASGNLNVYPNPFNSLSRITFETESFSKTEISIFDTQGRLIKNLSSKTRLAGSHTETWNGSDHKGDRVVPGIYFLRLTTGTTITNKPLFFLP